MACVAKAAISAGECRPMPWAWSALRTWRRIIATTIGRTGAGIFAKEHHRALREIGVVHPSRVEQCPIEVILRHLLERPRDRALLGGEAAVEIDPVFLFQVPADEGRIGDARAVIVDVGQLAFGRLAEAFGIGPIGQAGQLQEHLGFGHERARIRQTEIRPEDVERDHRVASRCGLRHCAEATRRIQFSGTINSLV